MYGCENILDSKFVLLVIQYKENIVPIHCQGNLIKFYKYKHVINAINYLKKAGIKHNDDYENIFKYKIKNIKNKNLNNNCNENNTLYTFYIIDFEDVTFLKKNNNKENQITINDLNSNIKNKSKKLNPNNSYFKNSNPSPHKRGRSIFDSNNN